MLTITNVVVQAQLNVNLDLYKLVHSLNNVKYNPKRFSAMIWHHKRIGGSCLLFKNGQMICNGAKSWEEARNKVRKYSRVLQKLGYPVSLSYVKLITASAVANLEKVLDLPSFLTLPGCAYEPELFNAAVFYRNSVHFSCFSTGKIVITGITSLKLIDRVVYPTLMEIELL